MKAITQLRIGLVAALLTIAFCIPGFVLEITLERVSEQVDLLSIISVIIHIIPVVAFSLYIFGLHKRKLKLTLSAYYTLTACFVGFAALYIVFGGYFVKETSEGLVSHITILIIVATIFVVLVLIPFKIGIKGLKKLLEMRGNH
jgi:prepilin signal peptidase PulO-like enzyme (type II secretory pathway)